VDNYLQVITAQTVALANQRNEIDILRRRVGASVLLVKALGGVERRRAAGAVRGAREVCAGGYPPAWSSSRADHPHR